MTQRTMIVASMLLLAATAASAQVHPCDAPIQPQQVIVAGQPAVVSFCARPSDNFAAGAIEVDGGGTDVSMVDIVQVSPTNVAGFALYRAPMGTLTVGAHTVSVTVSNRDANGALQASDPAPPLAFSAVPPAPPPIPKPATPTIVGVGN